MTSTWALTDDLSKGIVALTILLFAVSVLFLAVEMRRKERATPWVLVSGMLAGLALVLAVLRPVSVSAKTSQMGPRIVVLVDQSRRLLLAADDPQQARSEVAAQAVKGLKEHYGNARLSVMGFSDGELTSYKPGAARSAESDLSAALEQLSAAPGERPSAVVVVSDGRLSRPVADADAAALEQSLSGFDVPVHTVQVSQRVPKDASIRDVSSAGAAVAHQPLALNVEVGCEGLSCSEIPVTVRELLRDEAPLKVASGVADASSGSATIELEVTLDRAGTRVLEVAIDSPDGDTIPDNDRRYVPFSVAKERIRLLHLAGRPTYDVRALRTWLKSDESVDVVAFFILRGETDDPGASEQELALIRFPVDELFTEHLPSFDAIILQDIDAIRYKLSRYLAPLEAYVKKGGGLIMVGGPSSFAGGNYAGTPLDSVLPVEQPRQGNPFDAAEFVPVYTRAGAAAPVTRKLRSLLNGQLPSQAGANMLGAPRPGAVVLWEHPSVTVGSRGMPVLALGEAGDGRAIALGVDSTHRLAFGELAASAAGRAYGALWDGLLGWLMRDPRYEAARIELLGECIEGQPTGFRVYRLPGLSGAVELRIQPLSKGGKVVVSKRIEDEHSGRVDLEIEGLAQGGYTAEVRVGDAPATRHDFGCEKGGRAWADSRPDPDRLQMIAAARDGQAVRVDDIETLPTARLTEVTAERHVSPIAPAWLWTLVACVFMGGHWVVRRQSGLS